MASVKAIDARSVHQIQSGQVIVDLTSVVKELVENSLDAGATSLDVRFKSQGLESIEIQDNGSGISSADYESIALKHYTSKLSNYDDLTSLETFGFRGEALSSLCGVSKLHIVTARDGEAPKGTRLDFEPSGKLAGTSIAACQKGTTVIVEDLFHALPVRRRELEKNIKREYSKVLGLLHAYACISINVKFSVSNIMAKGKKMVVFSTKANGTTRDNIANVYGAKTVGVLIPLNLGLQLQPTSEEDTAEDDSVDTTAAARQVLVVGHVSRPVFGQGRQAPDRQMYFVNSRPCGLPQISKVFNEVYKSFNYSQSPFVFANFIMSTKAYDVNVSPDKRTILLHEQTKLLESLKEQLHGLFDVQDQTVPYSQLLTKNQLAPQPLTDSRPPPELGNSILRVARQPLINDQSDADDTSKRTNRAKAEEQARNSRRLADLHRAELDRISPDDSDGEDAAVQRRESRSREKSRHPQVVDMADEEDDDDHQPLKIGPRHDERQQTRTDHDRQMTAKNKKAPNPAFKSPLAAKSTGGSVPGFTTALAMFVAPGAQKPPQEAKAVDQESIGEDNDNEDSLDEDSDAVDNGHMTTSHGEGFADQSGDIPQHSPALQQDATMHGHLNEEDSENDNEPDERDSASAPDSREEKRHRRQEEARIRTIVSEAEASAAAQQQSEKRIQGALKNNLNKDSTIHLTRLVRTGTDAIANQAQQLAKSSPSPNPTNTDDQSLSVPPRATEEERLSLTISKTDFGQMNVVGQFNLGFILAVRSARPATKSTRAISDDLFIIDQHASDEIYNFSRLYQSTSLTPQPLVHPHTLQLTAIEEETILAHKDTTLVKNGFNVSVNMSGDSPVGQRCKLLTLPTSRETVFGIKDLEELLAMLGDIAAPASADDESVDLDNSLAAPHQQHLAEQGVVRPSRVRRMLAMRACRSSIMVGKTLNDTQQRRVVRHMGEIDRPWNCPHGRPTMRHLAGLGEWRGWDEWSAGSASVVASGGDDGATSSAVRAGRRVDWAGWLDQQQRQSLSDVDDDDE